MTSVLRATGGIECPLNTPSMGGGSDVAGAIVSKDSIGGLGGCQPGRVRGGAADEDGPKPGSAGALDVRYRVVADHPRGADVRVGDLDGLYEAVRAAGVAERTSGIPRLTPIAPREDDAEKRAPASSSGG